MSWQKGHYYELIQCLYGVAKSGTRLSTPGRTILACRPPQPLRKALLRTGFILRGAGQSCCVLALSCKNIVITHHGYQKRTRWVNIYHHDWMRGKSYKRFRVQDRVEEILWWLGFHAFISERACSISAGGLRSYKLSEATPNPPRRW